MVISSEETPILEFQSELSLRLPLRLEGSVGLVENDLRYGPAFVADKLYAVALEGAG